MIEIRLLRKKLQTRANELLAADSNTAQARLYDYLSFIRDDKSIASLIGDLPNVENDWVKWNAELWHSMDYGIPLEPKERVAFCLEVLERNKDDIVGISHNFHVSSNKINDHVEKYLETFVPFVTEYLDEKLQELETSVTSQDILDRFKDGIAELSAVPKDISERLGTLFKNLYSSTTPDEFTGIANTCRSILIDFAKEVYQDNYKPEGLDAPKGDDAATKLKFTLRAILSKEDHDRFLQGQEKLIDGCWTIINSTVHKKSLTKEITEEVIVLTFYTVKVVARYVQMNKTEVAA